MRLVAPIRSVSAAVLAALAVPAAAQEGAEPKPMGWTGVLGEAEFAALHQLDEGEVPELHGMAVRVGDSVGYLSLPKGGAPATGVLVIHEWWGLNDHVKHWADRLAQDGHAALAVDLYGGVVATTREQALEAMRAVDADAALQTLRQGLDFLAEDGRVKARKRACIGWCFGGGWSLRLAIAAPDLDAAVLYYGRLVDDPEQLRKIRAPVLAVFGNRDSSIPPEAVDGFAAAMKAAGRDAKILRYDADHAFANPSQARYDAEHAAAAWQEVRAFLGRHLRAETAGLLSDGTRELRYDLPESWKRLEPQPMRMVNLAVGDVAICYVTALPGTGGGVEQNLDRWCQQMGKEPLGVEALDALQRVPMLGATGILIRVDGEYQGTDGENLEDAVLLGAICALQDEAVFVKMIGPKAEVVPRQAEFEAFCRSLR